MLASSGRTVDDDAQDAIKVKRFLRRIPGSTILFLGFSGNGIDGKSS